MYAIGKVINIEDLERTSLPCTFRLVYLSHMARVMYVYSPYCTVFITFK